MFLISKFHQKGNLIDILVPRNYLLKGKKLTLELEI